MNHGAPIPPYSTTNGKSPATHATVAQRKALPRLYSLGKNHPLRKRRQKSSPALAVKNITGIDPSMAPSMAPETVVSGPAPAALRTCTTSPAPAAEDVFRKVCASLGRKCRNREDHLAGPKGTVEMLVPAPPAPPGTPPVPPRDGHGSGGV